MTYSEICKSVEKLMRKYDERDPFRLCRVMGIKLIFQAMGSDPDAIKGFFLESNRIRTITVDSDLPMVIQRIIVAHEICHIRQAAAMKAGGQGDRYTIWIGGHQSYLFFERSTNLTGNNIGRWFVERKYKN